jgi:GDP-L-fucose synthase
MEYILITGGSGLVGSAIKSLYGEKYSNYNILYLSSKECDLTNYEESFNHLKNYNIKYVIHLAAYVGGLYKNMNFKVDMLEKNTLININILKICNNLNINNVISCLSTCVFPDKTEYPINEDMLHDGPPHYSNDAYAYAKRLLETLSKSYNQQYGRNYICIIPTNIYGENDNYSLENGHVIPSLIHKAYLSKLNNKPFIIRGSGKPLRQFIYSKDLAHLIMWVLFNYKYKESIILADKKEYTIEYIGEQIAKCFNLNNIVFDKNYSDGQFKKTADNSKLLALCDFEFTDIETGIYNSCNWFIENYDTCRK